MSHVCKMYMEGLAFGIKSSFVTAAPYEEFCKVNFDSYIARL